MLRQVCDSKEDMNPPPNERFKQIIWHIQIETSDNQNHLLLVTIHNREIVCLWKYLTYSWNLLETRQCPDVILDAHIWNIFNSVEWWLKNHCIKTNPWFHYLCMQLINIGTPLEFHLSRIRSTYICTDWAQKQQSSVLSEVCVCSAQAPGHSQEWFSVVSELTLRLHKGTLPGLLLEPISLLLF